jgi:hypothetical protein
MPAAASESVTDELDDEFDLDIRIDDLHPADPDRIHLAMTFAASCTMCCPGDTASFFCNVTQRFCTNDSCSACCGTGPACAN